MLPDKFLEKLKLIVDSEKYNQIVDAIAAKLEPSFRVNTLKGETSMISQSLRKQGFEVSEVLWNKDAFVLKNKFARDLTETQEYKDGKIYIQNLSSMIPGLVLDPHPGDKVLDMAASPGSKTTQIAAMMKDRGEIVANDLSQRRIYLLANTLKQQGVSIARTSVFPGQNIWQKYPNYFDKVLVDAPCSMEGRFNLEDPKSYKDWSPKKVKILSKLQKHMLRSAVSATKPGGVIVYSTCTLSPEENEEVIDWILDKEAGNTVLEEIRVDGLKFEKALVTWADKVVTPEMGNALRVWPSISMEGFFVCKIRRLA